MTVDTEAGGGQLNCFPKCSAQRSRRLFKLVIGMPSASQTVSLTPCFLVPVARMSWNSFRLLPDAAADYMSHAHSDHQASRSSRKHCLILRVGTFRLLLYSLPAGMDRRSSRSCKKLAETQWFLAEHSFKPQAATLALCTAPCT
uniref:Uncharacterized protein n=1 Tax=Trichobilharzia regenti TaxID=157069 RepID=A0AA85JBC1_TRIRE|nr:unnamed protein product [Trichobilharzia regenti]